MLSIIIPAHNEEGFLRRCLADLAAQQPADFGRGTVEVIVVANACVDDTVAEATSFAETFAARGWSYTVLDLKEGGKTNAMNKGDETATGEVRAYLDADIRLDPDLFSQLADLLAVEEPRYASGRLRIAPAKSWWSRHYGRIYGKTPFAQSTAPGCGLFAMNRAGRARWRAFPDLAADDTFVRIQFAPHERFQTNAGYDWPIPEGLRNLLHVRRRQRQGDKVIWAKYHAQMGNAEVSVLTRREKARMVFRWPVSMIVFFLVNRIVDRTAETGSKQWSLGR